MLVVVAVMLLVLVVMLLGWLIGFWGCFGGDVVGCCFGNVVGVGGDAVGVMLLLLLLLLLYGFCSCWCWFFAAVGWFFAAVGGFFAAVGCAVWILTGSLFWCDWLCIVVVGNCCCCWLLVVGVGNCWCWCW